MARIIPMSEWGKDHWSLLAYVYSCTIDHRGYLDIRRLNGDGVRYPTRLRRLDPNPDVSREEPGHSDYDVLSDLRAAGLILPASGATPGGRVPWHDHEARVARSATAATRNELYQMQMTDAGIALGNALNEHKSRGGNFASFVPFDGAS